MATGFLDLDKLPERLFSDFPPKFEQLRAVYKGQVFHPEHHRLSISDFFAHALKNHDLVALQAELNENALPLPIPPYRHRLFYWSTICFYRAFYLLASYLRLDGGALHSWAYVTGYYSKFYLAKALLTLFQTAWVAFNKDRHGRQDLLLAYYGTQGIRVLDSKEQEKAPRGSHQQWWWLYEQLNHVNDWPSSIDSISTTLSDTYFSREQRNEVNYSEVFHEGFNELEWCDVTPEAMLSKLGQETPRRDLDITDPNEFFTGQDPEFVDAGIFYQDEAAILWNDLRNYLLLVEILEIRQSLLTREKLKVLIDRFIVPIFPVIGTGLHRQVDGLHLNEEPHPL